MRSPAASPAGRPSTSRTGSSPRSRDEHAPVLLGEAAYLPAVHRALQIIGTSVGQLGLNVERAGQRLEGSDVPAVIRRPNLDMSRSEFLEQLALSMATTGNAYVWRDGGTLASETTQLIPLDSREVHAWRENDGSKATHVQLRRPRLPRRRALPDRADALPHDARLRARHRPDRRGTDHHALGPRHARVQLQMVGDRAPLRHPHDRRQAHARRRQAVPPNCWNQMDAERQPDRADRQPLTRPRARQGPALRPRDDQPERCALDRGAAVRHPRDRSHLRRAVLAR